jgi:hypothetical protein
LTSPNLVESGNRAPAHLDIKAKAARVLLDALSTQCKSYCILAGYERLPDGFDTDIDFLVSQEDFDRMPRIIAEVARKTGTQLFQAIDHELTGRAYFLGALDGATLSIVQPDCAADYRHFGRRWLPAGEVLGARRRHPNGFYIPSTAHEFAYSLIKTLNERSFNREHGYRLHRLYVEDRIECGRMIARFCRGPEGSSIVRMASANDWTEMYNSIEPFRAAMLRSRKEPVVETLKTLPNNALYLLRRMVQPTGCWIAFMGPDGSGKSFVLNAAAREFAPSFRTVRGFHLRPGLIGRRPENQRPVTGLQGQPPRGTIPSIAKVLELWLDYVLGYLGRILLGLIRTELLLFDCCFYDLLVDSRRIRYGGPPSLLRAGARMSPRPDLVILLDAPPEVLRSRKQDAPAAEAARQRAAYLELAASLPNAVVVNAAQPPEIVIHDALAAILDHLDSRTRKRLGISNAPAGLPKRPW